MNVSNCISRNWKVGQFQQLLAMMAMTFALITTSVLAAEEAPNTERGNAPLVQKIEAKLGKPLTAQQKQDMVLVLRQGINGLREAQLAFVQSLSGTTGLPVATIQEMMPRIGGDNTGLDKNIIPKIEARLGRRLTNSQLQSIREADNTKKAAMVPIQNNMAQGLSRITGLSADDIKAMLPHIGL
jgi:hypothetical protein